MRDFGHRRSLGMVQRSSDASDRRFTRIVVTSAVREFMEQKTLQLTTQPLVEALGRVTIPERRAIARGLRILRNALYLDRSDD
jgi:hypothetical protein